MDGQCLANITLRKAPGHAEGDFGQAVSLTALVGVFSLGLAYRAYLRRLRTS